MCNGTQFTFEKKSPPQAGLEHENAGSVVSHRGCEEGVGLHLKKESKLHGPSMLPDKANLSSAL